LPFEAEETAPSLERRSTAKELLNLPIGRRVEFDARVMDLFEKQVLDPRLATAITSPGFSFVNTDVSGSAPAQPLEAGH
jgi:hypothetical protein